MASYQDVFKRYEMKYILDPEQTRAIRDAMESHTEPDGYAVSDVRNIYYDTQGYTLAVRSLAHPEYKEKLRLRKYSSDADDPAFVEIKKKCDGVTYKRRLSLPTDDAVRWLEGQDVEGTDTQIGHEIETFRDRYPTLGPAMMLCYARESFASKEDDLRITFDRDVTARLDNIDIDGPTGGRRLIPEGSSIMELKTRTAVPLWMAHALSDCHAYVGSFSKYGTAYQKLVMGA